MGVIGAEQLAQAKERAPDVRLDSAKRQGRLARDFFVRQATKEGERGHADGSQRQHTPARQEAKPPVAHWIPYSRRRR